MNVFTLLSMAFMNLWRRKTRTILTVLGMVIGTASIVIMVALGVGADRANQQLIEQMGAVTRIEVYPGQFVEGPSSGRGQMVDNQITDKTILAFSQIEGVVAATPLRRSYGFIKSGRYVCDVPIVGIDMSVAELFDIKLKSGDYPDAEAGTSVPSIILGATAEFDFRDANSMNYKPALDRDGNPLVDIYSGRLQLTFDYMNAMPTSMMGGGFDTGYEDGYNPPPKGKIYKLNVVGQLEEGNDSWSSYMDIVLLNKLAKQNKDFMGYDEKRGYDTAWVKVKNLEMVDQVLKQINDMGFSGYSMGSEAKALEENTRRQQALFGAVGAVALLVAVIGIMNTMLMSIYERTREIGVIKVLGCKMSNILEMFICEAAFIGAFGGIMGITLSYILTSTLNKSFFAELNMHAHIPVPLALGGVVFAMILAVLGGLYPSIRAMKLSPLAAIRNE